jgi:hypothetical protein
VAAIPEPSPAEAQRQKEQEELAKLRADAAAREKAAADEAQRKQIEEETRRKLEADAEAKRKMEEQERQAAEAAEIVLRLTLADRQRIQVALTALGFNTGGTGGVLNSRSREMIANWQRGHNYPVTGFLTGAQNQALLSEAAPAVARFDDEQKKIEETRKKADEDKARAEAAAKAAPPPAAPVPSPAPPPAAAGPNVAAAAPRSGPDGVWRGTMHCTPSRGGNEFTVGLQMTVSGGSGTWNRPGSGPGTGGIQSISLQISGAQVAVSRVYVPNNQPGTHQTGRMSARFEGNSINGAGEERGGGGRTCNISLTRAP